MKTVAVAEERRMGVRAHASNYPYTYSWYVAASIACFSIVRILLAASLELGTDESYYWLYTQRLRWNYFDHPAMVAFWGRLFSFNLLFQNELFIRLGSIVSAGFSTWFIFKATSAFSSAKAGWYAAVLLNTSFYASIVAGIFIMPDSPQLFFWTLSLWMLARITKRDDHSRTTWLVLGLAMGCCMMSKVHGAFIPFGFLLYCLLVKNELLRRPQLYIAFLISALCLLPLLIWNWNHDFVTFRSHGDRIVVDGFRLDADHFRAEWFGQLLMNNPVNVALIFFSLTIGYRYIASNHPQLLVLIFIGLPLCLFLLLVALFRSVFPHWSGPAYITLIPVAAIWLERFEVANLFPRWLRTSVIAWFLFITGWTFLINYLPGTVGSKADPAFGKGDVTLDRYGWKEAGQAFSNFLANEIRHGRMPANTPVIVHKWWGAHIEYYFCRPQRTPVIGLGKVQQVGTYLWMNDRHRHVDRSLALCVIPSDEFVDASKVYGRWYDRVSLKLTIDVPRNGKLAHRFYVYQLEGWKE